MMFVWWESCTHLIELRRQGIWTEQSWFPSEALFFNMGHVAPELFESFSVILRVNCRYHPGSCKGALNRDFGIRQPLLYRRIGPWRPGYIIPEPSQASSCATNSCCRSVVDTPIFERSCSPIHTNDWILWIWTRPYWEVHYSRPAVSSASRMLDFLSSVIQSGEGKLITTNLVGAINGTIDLNDSYLL